MRGHLQQGRRQLVALLGNERAAGWLLALFAAAVYLLTLDPSVSWWDCGEFIVTSHTLQVGHPPGAPLYQLLAHCAMLLACGNALWVAPLSNALSALSNALTVMVLFRTARELGARQLTAAVAALCYLFSDTAWFSAVESEVYAMAMLFCSLDVWLMLRWRRTGNPRLLLLLALSLGLGICVHLMTLLTLPALLWIFLRHKKVSIFNFQFSIFIILFFILGLTPYAVIPIRAAANPPINEGNPASADAFLAYLRREQYPKAPLYPRLWRQRDAQNWQHWGVDDPQSLADNARYYATYQLGYMYLRYFMYNFIGRENLAYRPDKENFSIFNFQFSIFLLPFLLGLGGMVAHWRRRRDDALAVTLLFLFGGIALNLYLNHPCYEPRERDYAYVLSFYAFALWIALGADALAPKLKTRSLKLLMLAAPLLMALGNWADHDRSGCHAVHDIALNHLQSCDHGAILITYGDNDTFPLWYLQQVEGKRTDIGIHNVNLEGYAATLRLLDDNAFRRPVYLTQYAADALGRYFPGTLRCEGFCHRLLPHGHAPDDAHGRHIADSIRWNITPDEYLDPVSRSFLDIWHENTKPEDC